METSSLPFKISAIAAMAKNRVIGVDNQLPWHIPEDLQYFKKMTRGKTMILGRKTYESFGARPLPGRRHLVISREPQKYREWVQDGEAPVLVLSSIKEAIQYHREHPWGTDQELFICGGTQIYQDALDDCDLIYMTVIDKEYPGDAKFPDLSDQQFELAEESAPQSHQDLQYRRLIFRKLIKSSS